MLRQGSGGRRWLSRIAVGVVAAALTGACGGSTTGTGTTSSTPIKIGGLLSLTGASGGVGLDIQHGAQVAIDQINAKGGVIGHKLELDVQDTAGQPAQAVQVFNGFANDPQTLVVLGPVNAAEVGSVTGLAEAKQLVVYAPASAGAVPGVTDLKFNPWTFRLNEALPLVVGPEMKTVVKLTGAKNVTVMNVSDNAAYVNVGDLWAAAAKDAGTTVQHIQFPTTTQDYSSIVTQVNKSADLIAIGANDAVDGPLSRALRQAGIKAQLMGDGSIFTSNVFTVSQGANVGAYSYSTYLPDQSRAIQDFISAFKKANGSDPSPIAAYSYEAVNIFVNAIRTKNAATRKAVRDGLSATKNYQGITGSVTYSGSGDAVRKSVSLVKIDSTGQIVKAGEIPIG